MKTVVWFIFAFLAGVPLAGQSCSDYSPPIDVIGFPQQTNSQYHITGYQLTIARKQPSRASIAIHRRTQTKVALRSYQWIWGYQGVTPALPQAPTT